MVGASGFEPPTSWSRTLGRPILQAFVRSCRSSIRSSFLRFLNEFPRIRLACACTELSRVDAGKGQEKGKVRQLIDSWFIHLSHPLASRCGRRTSMERFLTARTSAKLCTSAMKFASKGKVLSLLHTRASGKGISRSTTEKITTPSGHRQRAVRLTHPTPIPCETRLRIVASFRPS